MSLWGQKRPQDLLLRLMDCLTDPYRDATNFVVFPPLHQFCSLSSALKTIKGRPLRQMLPIVSFCFPLNSEIRLHIKSVAYAVF